MSILTITTQAEFDALPNSFSEHTNINIKSDPTITIVVNRKWNDASVWVNGNSSVMARGNSSVAAWDNSKVEAWDDTRVWAWDNSTVKALDNSRIVLQEDSSLKYAGSLADFSSWFLLNKDNEGIVEAMRKQFVDQPEYMQKISMILMFS